MLKIINCELMKNYLSKVGFNGDFIVTELPEGSG
jgi:hypothetical protein